MGAPVTVGSRIGHGTVSSIQVPAGKAPLGRTLQGRSPLVVEDEQAVRDGPVVLLQTQGAQVVAFDTVDSLQAWLASVCAAAPDLLLLRYRLARGRTGIDAPVAIGARWPGVRLPAIVVTGSTLGGHEDEAQTHNYYLLIKPVLPSKVRATISFKLGPC